LVVDEVPLAVLKKLKGNQHSQWPIDPMEQAAALSLTSLQYAAPRDAASESGPSVATSTILILPSSRIPQVLSKEPVITKIYSPYKNVPPAQQLIWKLPYHLSGNISVLFEDPIHLFIRVS
jgi:hypothetical protein